MQEDNLTEVEKAEYYRIQYNRGKLFTVVVGVLCFVLGILVARAYHLTIEAKF